MMSDTLDIKIPWRAALRLRIFVPALLIGSLVYWGTAIRPYLRLDDARVAARCTEVRSEQSGRLAALSHEEGAAIKQGEALFSFNTEEETEQQKQLQASIAMLNEVLARHLANADKAMQEYLTVRSEVEMGIASQEQTGKPLADLQEKQTLSKDCKEKLAAAVVSLDQVRRRMEQKTIAAPCSGIVIQRFKHEGEFLKAGEPVYSLCDPSQMWIEAIVPEKMIAQRCHRSAIDRTAGNRKAPRDSLLDFPYGFAKRQRRADPHRPRQRQAAPAPCAPILARK